MQRRKTRHLTRKQLKYFGTKAQKRRAGLSTHRRRSEHPEEGESRRWERMEHRKGISSRRTHTSKARRSSMTHKVRYHLAKRTTRRVVSKRSKPSSGVPTWLVGLLSGGAGLATGTTIGTVFGNDIKSALSKVPIIGNLFKAPDPVVQSALNGTPSPVVATGGGSTGFNVDLWDQAMTPGTDLNNLIESQNSAVVSSADYANVLANLNGGGF